MEENCGYFWGDDLQVTVLNVSAQHVTVSVALDDGRLTLSVIYGKCNHHEHRELWRSLKLEILSDEPWLGIGDFNAILWDEERRGGRPRLRVAMDDFNGFIEDCGLREMQSTGNLFSWCNG